MGIGFDFDSSAARHAMETGLLIAIRDKLRERILERIKPDIEAAIEGAVKHFEVTIQSMLRPENMERQIHVLLHDKRKE